MKSMQDFPANPIEKSGYKLEWSDEFDGPELDTSKGFPYYLPRWSSRERPVPNYIFRDSTLGPQITEDLQPRCPEFDGEVKASSIRTGLFAGSVGSKLGQLRFNPDLLYAISVEESIIGASRNLLYIGRKTWP